MPSSDFNVLTRPLPLLNSFQMLREALQCLCIWFRIQLISVCTRFTKSRCLGLCPFFALRHLDLPPVQRSFRDMREIEKPFHGKSKRTQRPSPSKEKHFNGKCTYSSAHVSNAGWRRILRGSPIILLPAGVAVQDNSP